MQIEIKMEEVTFDYIKEMTIEQFLDFLYSEYFPWKYIDNRKLARFKKCLCNYKTEDKMFKLSEIKNQIETFDKKDIKALPEQGMIARINPLELQVKGSSPLSATMTLIPYQQGRLFQR